MNKLMARMMLGVMTVGCLLFTNNVAMAKVDFKSGESVNFSGQKFEDMLMTAGAMVNGSLEVGGDLWMAGSNLKVDSNVGDDLNIAGGQIGIRGRVNDNLMSAGGAIELDASVGGNAFMAGGQVNVSKPVVIEGDTYIGAGMVVFDGESKGKLTIGAGQVIFNGIADGDVEINAEEFTLGENAKINGNLKYTSKAELKNVKSEQIVGKTDFTKAVEGSTVVDQNNKPVVPSFDWQQWLLMFILGICMLFVVGLCVVGFGPGVSNKVAELFNKKMGWSLLSGVVALAALPVIGIIAMITIIGLPLGMIIIVLYFVGWYVAKVLAGYALGSVLTGRKEGGMMSMVLALGVGLVVLEIIKAIPYVGMVFNLAFVATAMGAMILWYKERLTVRSNKK